MKTLSALAVVGVSALALTGCSFGPDPGEVQDHANEVFDALTVTLSDTDPGVLRTVEVVPTDAIACDTEGEEQQAYVARGTLSVRATDGAAADVVNSLAASLDGDEWEPTPSSDPDMRAFSNAQGISVTLSDASPLVLVGVFAPCFGAAQ